MAIDAPKSGPGDALALRPGMLEADDQKIRRILKVLDDVQDPAVNQSLLDPVRHRLALLKPARPPRFARVLFMPIDPLVVPEKDWLRGDPSIPRSMLAPIAKIVRAGLGSVGPYVDNIIAGGKADTVQAITQAGEALWPRAADILAASPPPDDWAETGYSSAIYETLAASMAAVLRRGPQLRSLALAEDAGTPGTDDEAMDAILRNIADESQMSCAMIARVVLVQSPRSAGLLRRIVAAGRNLDEKTALQTAMDRAIAAVLTGMERSAGFGDIGQGDIAGVGGGVRRVTTLLREIEADPASARHWPRLRSIRDSLDVVCRERAAFEVRQGLVGPLAEATGPIEAAVQIGFEDCARDLRKLAAAARKPGDADGYEPLLRQAVEAVRVAASAGFLTPMRQYRLVELLAGSDAAEVLYLKAAVS
jgi:hypothetical protein